MYCQPLLVLYSMDAIAELHDVAGVEYAGHGAVEDVAGVVAAVGEVGLVVGLVFSNLYELLGQEAMKVFVFSCNLFLSYRSN